MKGTLSAPLVHCLFVTWTGAAQLISGDTGPRLVPLAKPQRCSHIGAPQWSLLAASCLAGNLWAFCSAEGCWCGWQRVGWNWASCEPGALLSPPGPGPACLQQVRDRSWKWAEFCALLCSAVSGSFPCAWRVHHPEVLLSSPSWAHCFYFFL